MHLRMWFKHSQLDSIMVVRLVALCIINQLRLKLSGRECIMVYVKYVKCIRCVIIKNLRNRELNSGLLRDRQG